MELVIHWEKFLKGNKNSLLIIYQSVYENLYTYGIKMGASESITEDALQELFLKLWISRNKLHHIKNHKAFLFTCFRNLMMDGIKFQNRMVQLDFNEDIIFNTAFSPEDILITKQVHLELKSKITEALNTLSSRQKEAIYLRYFQSLNFESISEIMDINLQSVKNLIHSGLKKLKTLDFHSFKK